MKFNTRLTRSVAVILLALALAACGGGGGGVGGSPAAPISPPDPVVPVVPVVPSYPNATGAAMVKALVCNGPGESGWCWQQPKPAGDVVMDVFFVNDQVGYAGGM